MSKIKTYYEPSDYPIYIVDDCWEIYPYDYAHEINMICPMCLSYHKARKMSYHRKILDAAIRKAVKLATLGLEERKRL